MEENCRETSLDGIRGELLLHRSRTVMDGAIFWLASRVLIGLMMISKEGMEYA